MYMYNFSNKKDDEEELNRKEEQKRNEARKADEKNPRCSRCGTPGCRPVICRIPRRPGGS